MFKVGKFVYFPTLNADGKLYEIIGHPNPDKPIFIIKDGAKSNRSDGKIGIFTSDLFIFEANWHNFKHLSQLYPQITFTPPSEIRKPR